MEEEIMFIEPQQKSYSGRSALLLSTALCAGVLFQSSLVYAQEKLEEVVVTAQKRSEGINKVGITMQAFTAEMLADKGVHSAVDLETITPGLTVTEAAPTGVPVYSIRGVGFADFATASSSTVGLYNDDVALPYATMSRGVLFDVERVEVLKGPQGDLYGRNTTAGQINFISRKPTKEFEAGASADFSRFNALDVEGYISGPVAEKVQARLAAKIVESSKGWQQSISRPGDTLGKKDDMAVRGMINFDIAENASLLLNFHLSKDKSDNQAPTAYDGTIIGHATSQPIPTGIDATPSFSLGNNRAADWGANWRPKRDNTFKGFSAKLNWDVVDGINLTSITAYDKFDRDEKFETDGVPFVSGQASNTTDIKSFSQELRLASNDKSNLSWIVGGYYSHDTMSESYKFFMDQSYGYILGINQIDTRYSQTTKSAAGFGHVEWKFADKLKLTLGTRYTSEHRSWSGCTYDSGDGTYAGSWNNILTPYLVVPNGLPDPGLDTPGSCSIYDDIPGTPNYGKFAVFSDSITTNKWMGKAGLDYSPSDNVLIYGTISKGFKSGGFNGASAQTHSQLLPYKPETILAYEAGLKSTWLDGKMQFNAAAFYYDYKDKQEPTFAVTFVGNIAGLTNIPKSRVIGVEADLRVRPVRGLTIDMGATHIKTKILDYQAISGDSVWPNVITYDASGFELSNAPKWQANGTAAYVWALNSALNMTVGGDLVYKASTAGSTQDLVSDYVLVNARMGISDASDRWSVTVWGRNIFNKYYWVSAFAGNGTYVRMNGMPVTYGVTLAAKF
jgi:iron complex outermembrane receptor protein